MMKKLIRVRIAAIVAVFTFVAGFFTTRAIAAGPGTVNLTVTAVGKKDTSPPLATKDDVLFFVNKDRTQVADWKHGEKLFLAVLIDESLDSGIAAQWNDLKAFLAAQPDNTYVLVAYASNGTARIAQDFTNDHQLAAKALRLPLGSGGAFGSPYLALLDLMKRWPDSPDRRSILLISSGIDYFRGGSGIADPDVDPTINRAQKQNTNIWTIYAPDSGHRARGFFLSTRAQSNLSQISDETGAESYYLGTGAPVSIKPYLDELSTHLSNQYLLTFVPSGGPKGRFARAKVTTELPFVEFLHAAQVYVPSAK
jgi:hypothetical protein